MASEDLLAYLKLEAEVFDGYTVHPSYRRNRTTGVIEKVEAKWVRTKSVGEGAFGQVWQEHGDVLSEEVKVRAVKVVRKEQMRRLHVDYKKELLALATFSKQEYRQADVLVTFLNWFETDESIFLAMEYFRHGDLATHLSRISAEDEVRQITTDLLEGLKIMHSEGFTHRDLKPQNIFVAEKPPQAARWWVKIGDFGISKRVKNEETALRTQTGTPYFQAPEIHGFISDHEETSEYGKSVDVWSLGCVVYNISAQQIPFGKMSEINSFCQNRSQLSKAPLSRLLSRSGIEFVSRLLVPKPAQRMTVHQALQDTWILTGTPLSSVRHVTTTVTSPKSSTLEAMETSVVTEPGISGLKAEFQADLIGVIERGPYPQKTRRAVNHDGQHGSGRRPKGTPPVNVQMDRPVTPKSPGEVTSHSVPMFASRLEDIPEPQMGTSKDPHNILATTANNLPSQSNQPVPSLGPPDPSRSSSSSMGQISDPLTVLTRSVVQVDGEWAETMKLTNFASSVCAVAFSPNDTLLASSSDTLIQLWHVNSTSDNLDPPAQPAIGTVFREFSGHTRRVNSVAFSPNGASLASGSDDMSVRVWNIAEGIAKGTAHRGYPGHTRPVRTVAFSPDGTILASGSWDRTVRIWRDSTGEFKNLSSSLKLPVVLGRVNTVTFSRDGTLLAIGDSSMTITVWHMAHHHVRHKLSSYSDWVQSLAFSPDGTLLASGANDKTVRLWDVATGKRSRLVMVHGQSVTGITFSPDCTLLASSSDDDTVRLWHVSTGKIYRKLVGHRISVLTVAFSRDGTLLASGAADKTVRLWSATTKLAPSEQVEHTSPTGERVDASDKTEQIPATRDKLKASFKRLFS